MASSFPGAIDSFTDPLSGSALNSPSHSAQHADLNDAAEKIETYMGLVKVIPTSATGGTVGSTGTVTIGTTQSSVTVSGAFSSLYDIYNITMTGGVGSGAAAWTLKLGSTATGYYNSGYVVTYAGVGAVSNVNNGSAFGNCGIMTTDGGNACIGLNGPNLAKRTYYTANYIYGATAGGGDAMTVNGYENSTTQHTAFTITFGGGTMTGGTIRVYGYRN
jgi:hypothetical protein